MIHRVSSALVHSVTKKNTSFLVVAFLLFWAPIIIFSKLAGEVIEREPIGIDSSLLNLIHSHANSFFDQLFLTITFLGNIEVIVPVTVLILLYLVVKKQQLNALIVSASFAGAAVANVILKFLFHRDRPSVWQTLITEHDYSFPSGHAMLSAALVVSLVFILWDTRWRWPMTLVGTIFVLSVGFSRLYLGVHYPSDIIAGWSVSCVWVFIVFTILQRRKSNT